MTKRCFIAINLSEEDKDEIEKLIIDLKKINPSPFIRYAKNQAIHLTLHFLGSLEPEQINQVKKILKSRAGNFKKTKLTTEDIGAFPNLNQPKVIFLGTNEADGKSLIGLQKNIGKELEKINIEVDHRPWQAHLTLARIKGSVQFKINGIDVPKLKIPVANVELMESRLKPKGAEHAIIESFRLKNNSQR